VEDQSKIKSNDPVLICFVIGGPIIIQRIEKYSGGGTGLCFPFSGRTIAKRFIRQRTDFEECSLWRNDGDSVLIIRQIYPLLHRIKIFVGTLDLACFRADKTISDTYPNGWFIQGKWKSNMNGFFVPDGFLSMITERNRSLFPLISVIS